MIKKFSILFGQSITPCKHRKDRVKVGSLGCEKCPQHEFMNGTTRAVSCGVK